MNDNADVLQRALAALRASNARLAEAEARRCEPIAIIGVGCRFPGGASSPDRFWRLLVEGRDAIVEVPAARWRIDDFYDADPEAPGAMVTRWGGFVDDVRGFDPGFFGITPRDAAHMDPQHRLFLEVAWEALEQGGQTAPALRGARGAVFVGLMNNDYARVLWSNPDACDAYATTGFAPSLGVNRLSYFLDLRGPSVAVDSACSSSLVAIHQACAVLRSGEADLAIAGGVNLMLSPEPTISFSKFGMMSPDGRCRTFDAGANGYVRGEGCGVLVLKRLSDARRDRDPVRAVVLGSAVNQDGRSNGFTAPNPAAQEAVVRAALAQAGLSPEAVTYVEAHGTGTPLGDPIEVGALDAVYGRPRAHGIPCAVGSVKTNIGHLEAAAGAAGAVKVVLALQHQHLPAHLHLAQLNPFITLDGSALELGRHDRRWHAPPEGRIGGISSFGAGGTNAHVLIGQAPDVQLPASRTVAERRAAGEPGAHLLVLSAHAEPALREVAANVLALLADPTIDLADVCYTASARRTHHDHRLAVVGRDAGQLRERLAGFLRGEVTVGVAHGRVGLEAPRVAFVFPGQGSQWPGMARQLLAESLMFRDAMAACDAALYAEIGESLLALLQASPPPARLDDIDVMQPALFAIEVALAAVWRSLGVEPVAVIGHSMGEVAAAHVAGALSLTDAARIICRRSRLLRRIAGQGAMAIVALPQAESERLLVGVADRLAVAVASSPGSTVIAGDPVALDELLTRLTADGTFCRRIKVDVASHSPQVDALRDDLLAALAEVAPRRTELPLHSTVTARVEDGSQLDASYWVANLRMPVQMSPVIQSLIGAGTTTFLEISPHPILLSSIEDGLRHAGGNAGLLVSSLRRDEDAWETVLFGLGQLHVNGLELDWHRIYPLGGRVVDLPAYPWQREPCWVDEAPAARPRARVLPTAARGLLGPAVGSSLEPGMTFWEMDLDLEQLPYLADHRVRGAIVAPGALWLVLALEAARELCGESAVLAEVELVEALLLDAEPRRVQLVTTAREDGGLALSLSSRARDARTTPLAPHDWTLHAKATARPGSAAWDDAGWDEVAGGRPSGGEEIYARMARRGLDFGPVFRGVTEVRAGTDVACGAVRPPAPDPRTPLHPAALDACLQVSLAAIGIDHDAVTFLPVRLARISAHFGPAAVVVARVRARHPDGAIDVDLRGRDVVGRPCLEVDGLRLQPVRRGAGPLVSADLYEHAWTAAELIAPFVPRGRFLVIDDGHGLGAAIERQLAAAGTGCAVAYRAPAGAAHGWRVRDDARGEAGERAVTGLRQLVASVGPLEGVIALAAPAADADLALSALASSMHALLELASALQATAAPPRLWLVTRGAHAVDPGDRPVLGHAALGAVVRVLREEAPALRAVHLDGNALAAGQSQRASNETSNETSNDVLAAFVAAELTQLAEEETVAWRGERRVMRLVRSARILPPPVAPCANETILITGGLGGVGLALAEWLVERGARHLCLLGRRPPLPATARMLAAWRARGAQVMTAEVDVADEAALAGALAELRRVLPPLGTVFHAAGVLDDAPFQELGVERIAAVLAPKVAGALGLHRLTQGDPVRAFVLFSSASTLLGLPGQAAYAAANAVLDGLAQVRHSEGLPALAVNWGAWGEVGLAARADRSALLAARGFAPMPPDEALDLLARLQTVGVTHAAAMRFDAAAWRSASAQPASGLLKAFVELAAPQAAGDAAEAVRRATPEARVAAVIAYLSRTAIEILRSSAARIEPEQSLLALGFDSLMTLTLRTRIQRDLAVRLTPVAVLEHPTLRGLARHVDAQLASAGPSADTRVAELSDDEVDALLRQVLTR